MKREEKGRQAEREGKRERGERRGAKRPLTDTGRGDGKERE